MQAEARREGEATKYSRSNQPTVAAHLGAVPEWVQPALCDGRGLGKGLECQCSSAVCAGGSGLVLSPNNTLRPSKPMPL